MDPSAVVRPVGPLPPAVYWRRRLALLVVLAIVLLLIARACGGSSPPSHPAAGAGNQPTTTTTPQPPRCAADSTTAAASTDAVKYPAGAVPKLRVTIRTNRPAGCILAITPSTVVWSVYSGPDLVWTTAQCPAAAPTSTVEVQPSHPIARIVGWDRRRSTTGCAAAGRLPAQPGTYQLFVTVLGDKVGPAVFHLTG